MVVYGIASGISKDVADFYESLDEAEAALAGVVADAPELARFLWVERIELAEFSMN